MPEQSSDLFSQWAAKPEWEKNYRKFYVGAPESAFKALKIASLIAAALSWPFRGWERGTWKLIFKLETWKYFFNLRGEK